MDLAEKEPVASDASGTEPAVRATAEDRGCSPAVGERSRAKAKGWAEEEEAGAGGGGQRTPPGQPGRGEREDARVPNLAVRSDWTNGDPRPRRCHRTPLTNHSE